MNFRKSLFFVIVAITIIIAVGSMLYPYLINKKVALEHGSISGVSVGSSTSESIEKAKTLGFKHLISSCLNDDDEYTYVGDISTCGHGESIVVLQKGSIFQRFIRIHSRGGKVDRIELVWTMDSL